jgi:hypothetical protein
MVTGGAELGCLFAYMNVAAVDADPDGLAIFTLKDNIFLDIGQETTVAFLVVFFPSFEALLV